MSLLSAIFGAVKPTYREVPKKAPVTDCLDHTLMPRWRSPKDMDDPSKAIGFVCHQCGREYLPVEVKDRHLIRGAGW